MATRIGVGRLPGNMPYYVTVQGKRGTTNVDLVDGGPFMLPFSMGVGLLAWELQLPAVVPASGAWSFDCPILSEFPTQTIGLALSGANLAPLQLTAGVLTTPLDIGANQKVTLRGMVTT